MNLRPFAYEASALHRTELLWHSTGERTRTSDRSIRSRLLYPAELRLLNLATGIRTQTTALRSQLCFHFTPQPKFLLLRLQALTKTGTSCTAPESHCRLPNAGSHTVRTSGRRWTRTIGVSSVRDLQSRPIAATVTRP